MNSISLDQKAAYSPGKRLHLTPHKPPPPYGSCLYPMPEGVNVDSLEMTEEEENLSEREICFDPRNAPLNIDESNQGNKDFGMEVEILQMIGGVPDDVGSLGTHKLLCRVIVAPSATPYTNEQRVPIEGQQLFLKIFDPLFWFDVEVDISVDGLRPTSLADMAISDEFAAYHYLFAKGMTGMPHLAPDFLGGWTTEVESVLSSFRGMKRVVTVLATEYIDGVCLGALYETSGPVDKIIKLHDDGKKSSTLRTGFKHRMRIMAKIMDGTISQEFIGVHHGEFHPRNFIITMRNLGQPVKEPRVAMVGWHSAIVDHLRQEPVEMYRHFTKKIHPYMRFRWNRRLLPFEGWIPSEWKGPEDNIKDSPMLSQWMVKTFGSVATVDNPTYEGWGNMFQLATVAAPSEGNVTQEAS
ncbi:hypothetical protein CkaCkLH20_10567 [Colletotrichum karsti]|uniref:Uncharacterized protein n=1 Tax=Colletotrichum karsti TaxID=1095194 RepID=A0A9P6LGU1_9PEZI|nr:uncharacterized protein CkaCkLH20_10567 [Colletotrichum karsti]KAF9871935.1 hypothetical protein CkaCkLH20_10567 [Colletotrichum karsti]